MPDTPSFAELEQEVNALRKIVSDNDYLEHIYHTIAQPVVILDRDQNILSANLATEKSTGQPVANLVGKKCYQVFHDPEATSPPPACPFNNVITSSQAESVEIREETLHGTFLVSLTPVFDQANRLKRVIHISTDLSMKKEIERDLKESEQLFRGIFEDSLDGMALSDTTGRYLQVNQALSNLLGYSKKELLTLGVSSLTYPGDVNPHSEEMKGIMTGESDGFTVEKRYVHKNGTIVWSDSTIFPIRHANGKVKYFVGRLRDISARKKAEQALHESERRHRNLVNNLPGTTYQFAMGADGAIRFDYLGEKCRDLFGIEADEIKADASSVFNLIPQPDADIVANAIRQSAATLTPYHVDHRVVKPSGETIWVHASSTPRRKPDGETIWDGIGLDITERKEAEQAVQISAKRFRELFDNMSSGVAIYTSLDGGQSFLFKDMNKAGLALTQKHKEEVVGREVREVYPGVESMGLFGVFQRVWQTGEPEHHPTSKYSNGQIQIWVENYVCKLPTGELVAIYEDTTARRQAEETRDQLAKQIQETQKMESIGNLAGGIAHDFNNILFPIVGMSELLLEDLPGDSLEYENAQEILKAGKRGRDLVKQILTFSRKSEHQMMPIRVQQVLREVLKLSRSTIPANIEIEQQIQNDCGLVQADPSQIHQIAMNLITNAYHAVPESAGKITVGLKEIVIKTAITSDPSPKPGRYALLTITDNGAGIDPAIKEKIFEPYFTTKAQGKGTGLGLAVVYGIVKEHHGDIRIISEPQKGATFEVYLPLMKQSPDPLDAAPKQLEPEYRGNERILLVDDEVSIIRIEKQILTRLGYTITSHTGSTEALAEFQADPYAFDLVISDMTMPNLTGDQLAQAMIAANPKIPIILCTGFSEKINQEKAEELGIKGFLMKPIVKSDIARTVREVLDQARESQ